MKSFREQSIDAMKDVIAEWKSKRKYTYESKNIYANISPIIKGEVVLHASNAVDSFFKDQTLINTFLLSRYFQSNTLSVDPLSDNAKADSYRLKKFLEEFDEEFYAQVAEKISDDDVQSSDPLFW